jgi:hypothetical protein
VNVALTATFSLAALAFGRDEVRVSTTAELRTALASAKPGVHIAVAPGEYEGFQVANVRGEQGRVITVAAADAAAPPEFRGGVQLSDVAYLELRALVFANAPSNGLNIDDGGMFDTPSHHVVLRDIAVRDCGGRGNDDGIKLSGVDDFRLENCTVERWGRGGSAIDMVGCHRGVIEGCTIRDKEDSSAATGIQAKGGSRDVAIRACRFEHAGERAVNIGGSTGLEYFRPKPEGFEAKDIAVEGCTFIGSIAPIAFVGVDGASVRFNTIFRPRKWAVRILQETRGPEFVACRKGAFEDNLIAYRASELSTAVNVGPETASETFSFARNYWFCIDGAEHRPQIPTGGVSDGADPKFVDAEHGDLRLAGDSPARAHGAGAYATKR